MNEGSPQQNAGVFTIPLAVPVTSTVSIITYALWVSGSSTVKGEYVINDLQVAFSSNMILIHRKIVEADKGLSCSLLSALGDFYLTRALRLWYLYPR